MCWRWFCYDGQCQGVVKDESSVLCPTKRLWHCLRHSTHILLCCCKRPSRLAEVATPQQIKIKNLTIYFVQKNFFFEEEEKMSEQAQKQSTTPTQQVQTINNCNRSIHLGWDCTNHAEWFFGFQQVQHRKVQGRVFFFCYPLVFTGCSSRSHINLTGICWVRSQTWLRILYTKFFFFSLPPFFPFILST